MLRKTSPQHQGSGDLVTVLRVAIESGALYSATMFVSLILFLVRSNGLYIMSDIVRIRPMFGTLHSLPRSPLLMPSLVFH